VAVGFSLDLQGMTLTGYVSVAGTVTCVLRNGTGGAMDLGSGTLRADVWRACALELAAAGALVLLAVLDYHPDA
jgi:hypothetical protein